MAEEDVCLPFSGEIENEKTETENERAELKRGIQCVVNDESKLDVDTAPRPCKKQANEVSNDKLEVDTAPPPCMKLANEVSNEDICSEVTDSIVSPRENENTSTLKEAVNGCETGKIELRSDNQLNPSEISSGRSGNSSTESYKESPNGSSSPGSSTSHVILEIPKHASSTGIRKITFKFSKSKTEHESKLTTSAAQPVDEIYGDGVSQDYFSEQPNLYDASYLAVHNMELKMSKKVLPHPYPTNVKKLLSTGILEGARVKYISTSGNREIPGIIRGSGYCCGCLMCNYTNVLSAYEFEKHAGGAKTRHPNNHIHLENGRPIYSIIEELKTAPLGMLEEVVKQMAGPSFNEDSFCAWKAGHDRDDDMAGLEKYEGSGLLSRSFVSHPINGRKTQHCPKQLIYSKEVDEEKNLTKRSLNIPRKKSSNLETKKRDNDLHRLLFMPNGLPEGTKLSYCVKGKEILSGYKQDNGIVCSHCDCEVSPSQFESHAGWGARRQPYRHIYTSEGFMLHDIALKLANGQLCIAGHSDDMCAVCGDGGDLILCPECPRSYHKGCLPSEDESGEKKDGSDPSDNKWRCPECCNRKEAPDSLSNNARPIVVRVTREIKKTEIESGGCIICRAKDFSSDKFDDRTMIICDQCEKDHHVGCLRDSDICDLKELPRGKWFCCGDCDRIHAALQELVSRGVEMVPQMVVADIIRKCVVKGLGEIAESDVQWQILCGKGHPSSHRPLLSRAVSIFREGFNPIVVGSGRDLIPVMVYGRNISGEEYAGMYTVVLYVKSVVVSAALLRVFGREVAELPLVATTKENRGKGYCQALLSCIEGLLCSLSVRSLVLPAAGEAKSIWTNKLGFTTMKQEQVLNYTKVYHFAQFRGTSWLEKILEPAAE